MKNLQTAKNHVGHGFSQFRLTNYLLNNLSQFNLSPIAKLVLLELSACYNPKKADMFPKQKTLAKKIGVSERSIVRAIQELVKEGLVLVESKYSNHYIFTSKISQKLPQNDKNFYSENMSEDLRRNNIQNRDNLSPHKPIIEPIKKPLKVEDYKILKNYAIQKGAKNLQAYINALIKSGSAEKIIANFKKSKANQEAMLEYARLNQENLEYARLNAVKSLPQDYFENIRKQIKSPAM